MCRKCARLDKVEESLYVVKESVASEEEAQDIEVTVVLCAKPEAATRLREHTIKDPALQKVIHLIMTGWSDSIKRCPSELQSFIGFRDELSYYEGLVFKGNCIVIPKFLVSDVLKQLDHGYFGVEKCVRRAKKTVFWINMHTDITHYVKSCSVCQLSPRSNFNLYLNANQYVITRDMTILHETIELKIINFYIYSKQNYQFLYLLKTKSSDPEYLQKRPNFLLFCFESIYRC
jgi:hypothetical protein